MQVPLLIFHEVCNFAKFLSFFQKSSYFNTHKFMCKGTEMT